MVERRVCTFCGQEIEPGTGRMFIKRDGVVYQFCTSKCFKNLVELKRIPRRTTWTEWCAREKQVRVKGAEPEVAPGKTRKVRKRAKPKKESAADEKPEPEEAGQPEDAGADPEEESAADADAEQGEKE